jgi:hypothetical protein
MRFATLSASLLFQWIWQPPNKAFQNPNPGSLQVIINYTNAWSAAVQEGSHEADAAAALPQTRKVSSAADAAKHGRLGVLCSPCGLDSGSESDLHVASSLRGRDGRGRDPQWDPNGWRRPTEGSGRKWVRCLRPAWLRLRWMSETAYVGVWLRLRLDRAVFVPGRHEPGPQ